MYKEEIQYLILPVRQFLFFCIIATGFTIKGQIVDDSTKQVYGPKTTKFITPSIILDNLEGYRSLDTSIYLLERQSVVDKSQRQLQNLGVLGTAQFPLFHAPSKNIGRASGFDAYSRFAFDPYEVKFYDTKSPFFDLFAMLGGGNRNIIDIGFSRNINPNWNFGFDYKLLTIDKQLARNGQGDRQIESSAFVGYTHYKHGKLPYQILFQYSQLNHNAVELGGTRFFDAENSLADLFQFENALLQLEDARTSVKERRIHLYQDYEIAKQLQIYHILDNDQEEHTFQDFVGGSVGDYNPYTDYYNNYFVDPDSTYQRANFSSFSNEIGAKGDLASIFYRAYLRFRFVDFSYNYLDPKADAFEQYVGGLARFKWRDKFSVQANGEYILGGGYDFKGTISSGLINGYYRTSNYAVPFVYQSYFGNHHEWQNSYSPIFTNQLGGNIKFKIKFLELVPELELASYRNYLFFDQQRQARQNPGTFVISKAGGHVNFRFFNAKKEGWHLENQLYLTTIAGDGASQIRIPDLFYNGRFFWRGNWFNDLVPFEVGLDTHARSAYFANNFAPETQQFFIQDEFIVPDFFTANLFINMKLDKFFLSLKWTHLDQPNDGGYLASPFYPGQPRAVDVNVRWLFFD